MLDQDDLWLMDEELFDEPSELLDTLPEVRHYVDADQRSDEGWIRSVLERPEALRKAWLRHANRRKRKKRHGSPVPRAA